MLNCFVSIDGDNIGSTIGRASLDNNIEELRRLSNLIDAGNRLWTEWATDSGGEVVGSGGDEARLNVPADKLREIPKIARKYYDLTGFTVTVGVGQKISEADKALLAGKLESKNCIRMYDESVEKILASAHQKTEAEKIDEEYLAKASSGHKAGANPFQEGRLATGLPSEPKPSNVNLDDQGQILQTLHQASKEHPPEMQVAQTPAQKTYADIMHSYATTQAASDAQPIHQKNQELQGLKERVAAVLEQVRAQEGVIEEIQEVAPDTYDAILALADSVIALARELKESDPEEAEAFQKSFKSVMPLPKPKAKKRLSLPVGTALNGKVKVKHMDGTSSWANVKDGQVLSSEGNAISARYPDSDKITE